MRVIPFNSQRNNNSFNNKFPGFKQCFSTCAWMLMSYYAPEINPTDDTALSRYVDDVSNIVGKPGIGELVQRAKAWITGNTAYWWEVQRAGIEKWLQAAAVSGRIVYRDAGAWAEINNALVSGPVILGTNKLGGLSGGHIILLVDIAGSDYIVNDPYGDARTNYRNTNGAGIRYNREWLKQYASPRYMYWKK